MIYNQDGTPYKLNGKLSQFNPDSNEHNLFNQWDQESIIRGGTPIYYYECLIQPQTIHPVYLEDRGKLYSNNPIQMWGLYEPIPSENYVDQFGWDSPNDEVIYEFNYRHVLNSIGHLPKIDSRIYTPHLQENWKIINRKTGEFKKWGVLRLQLRCSRFQESTTVQEGRVTANVPNEIKVNK